MLKYRTAEELAAETAAAFGKVTEMVAMDALADVTSGEEIPDDVLEDLADYARWKDVDAPKRPGPGEEPLIVMNIPVSDLARMAQFLQMNGEERFSKRFTGLVLRQKVKEYLKGSC